MAYVKPTEMIRRSVDCGTFSPRKGNEMSLIPKVSKRWWSIVLCVCIIGSFGALAQADPDGTVTASATTPDKYIPIILPVSPNKPSSVAKASAGIEVNNPNTQAENLTSTTYQWTLLSVSYADQWWVDLDPTNYNSTPDDPVIVDPTSPTTDVRLGLNIPCNAIVTLMCTVTWNFSDGTSASSDSNSIDISFYGVQTKIIAIPTVIAANTSGCVPITLQICGPQYAKISNFEFHLTDASGAINVDYKPALAGSGTDQIPAGLCPGDVTEIDPAQNDHSLDPTVMLNGRQLVYSVLVPPSALNGISMTSGSHRTGATRCWIDGLAIVVTDSEGGAYLSGDPLSTGDRKSVV